MGKSNKGKKKGSAKGAKPAPKAPPAAAAAPAAADPAAPEAEVYPPLEWIGKGARIKNMAQYEKMYKESIENNSEFWRQQSKEIDFFSPYTDVTHGSFDKGDVAWFLNGKLNVSYNCLDRHVKTNPDKTAILFEGDEPGSSRAISYKELLQEVCQFANALKRRGVKKGDAVCIYMPMVPEAAVAMLACTRLGAPHSVVFAGFSSQALQDRILDCNAKVVITADCGVRGGRVTKLKELTDVALEKTPNVNTVFVFKRTEETVNIVEGRDVWWHEAVACERPYCPPEWMDSEDTLFMLYTSGSTGKPKGIQHSTAGYLLWTMITHKYVFDIKPDDVYACVADVGWITGHSYIVYGPLANCSTTLMFESTPLYPDASRYWDMVERHRISIFYTAPTAVRALMKFGEDPVKKHDLSSLRVLGSVGEPINPEAWKWYYDVVGSSNRAIVDTYWQTETGGIMVTPLPGCTPMKPGAAMRPFFGISLALMDEKGDVMEGNDKQGVLCVTKPWPGMVRTVYGDHNRFMNTYMTAYPGNYFTGDGCTRDKDGDYWITGRVDDVINVSGHRLGSAEIESALVEHPMVVEAAVVGVPHDIKGQGLFAYVLVKEGTVSSPEILKEMKLCVRRGVGPFAQPDGILIAPALPKTRSGKIMRRLLRKVACCETENLGDTSTLADPSVVDKLIAGVAAMQKK